MEHDAFQEAYVWLSYFLVISLYLGFLFSEAPGSAGILGIIGFFGVGAGFIGLSVTAILQNLGVLAFAVIASLLILPIYLWYLGEKRANERKEECEKKAKQLFPEAPPKALKIVEGRIYSGSSVSGLLWDGDTLIEKDGANEKIIYSKSIAKTPPKGKIYAKEMSLIDGLMKEHSIAVSETIKHYIAMMTRFGWDIGSTKLDEGFISIDLSRNQEAMIVKLPCWALEPEIPAQSALSDPSASAKIEASE